MHPGQMGYRGDFLFNENFCEVTPDMKELFAQILPTLRVKI